MRPLFHSKARQQLQELEDRLRQQTEIKRNIIQHKNELIRENQKLKKDKEEAYYLIRSLKNDYPHHAMTKSQRWDYLTNLLHGPSKPQDKYDALKHYVDNLHIRLQELENTLRYHCIIPPEDPDT